MERAERRQGSKESFCYSCEGNKNDIRDNLPGLMLII